MYIFSTEDCVPDGPYRAATDYAASVPGEGLLVGTNCINTEEVTVNGEALVSEVPSPELRFDPVLVRGDALQLGERVFQRE